MRYVLVLSYDGTAYCGWQRQKNGLSVQEVVETAIRSLTGADVTVTGSGRTDAGVHALAQVAHFDGDFSIPPEKFYLALNPYLPPDVKAIASFAAPPSFHARYSAKKKTYRYSFYYSAVVLPVKDRYAQPVAEENIDLDKLRNASEVFLGEHDFAAFRSVGSSVKDTVRTIYAIRVEDTEGGFYIEVTGNGFLYNMVRVMVGSLLAVANGDLTAEEIAAALSSGQRDKRFKTLPAKGLLLVGVQYPS